MFSKITFAAVVATTVVSVTVLATPSSGTDETVSSTIANVLDQGWCSGPRQHTDFRCVKS